MGLENMMSLTWWIISEWEHTKDHVGHFLNPLPRIWCFGQQTLQHFRGRSNLPIFLLPFRMLSTNSDNWVALDSIYCQRSGKLTRRWHWIDFTLSIIKRNGRGWILVAQNPPLNIPKIELWPKNQFLIFKSNSFIGAKKFNSECLNIQIFHRS